MRSSNGLSAGNRGGSVWSGVLVGIGLAGFLDETIFHQILHWHHFVDGGSQAEGLVSDGLFHAFSWVAIVAGLLWFAELRRRQSLQGRTWGGGVLLGTGGFQLYDGIVQHKLMRLHQIRYGVDLLPYDLTWNLLAGVLLAVGAMLVVRARTAQSGETDADAPRRG